MFKIIIQSFLLISTFSGVCFASDAEELELQIIPRSQWNAKPPTIPLDKLNTPTRRVIVAHTVTGTCNSFTTCSKIVRSIQEHHFSRDFADIAYNFIIGGDGLVYEGRGWDFVGAHTKGYNQDSIGIGFIGNFMTDVPTDNQLRAGQLLLEDGMKLGKLAKDYSLYGHRQLVPTLSPGNNLYDIIKGWGHWSEIVGFDARMDLI